MLRLNAALLAGAATAWVALRRHHLSRERQRELVASACPRSYPDVPTLRVKDFLAWRDVAPWRVVDARSRRERAVSTLSGAIPTEALPTTSQPALVYCTIGCRSAARTLALRRQGVPAFNLWGGVLAWAAIGLPFVTPDGAETRRVHVYASFWDLLPPGYEAVF